MKQILLLFLFITVQGYTQWTNDNLNETTNTFYGRAVSISGDGTVLAVGTYFDGAILDEYNNLDGRGSVSIYKKDETNTWIETTNIVSENIESVGGHFGYSLSLNSDGTVLVIGAPLAGNGQILNLGSLEYTSTNGKGFVSVYTKDESDNWSQVGGDIIGENDNEYFGWSVSISDDGNTIASGGYGYDNESGIARIYKKDDTTNNWIKSIEFNGIEQGQRTGFSLSLSGDGNTLV